MASPTRDLILSLIHTASGAVRGGATSEIIRPILFFFDNVLLKLGCGPDDLKDQLGGLLLKMARICFRMG